MKNTFSEYNTIDYLKDDIELQKEYINESITQYKKDKNIRIFLKCLAPLIDLYK